MPSLRYVMIGGFLGAGKTTAIRKLADHLSAQGLRVGLITNDQSTGLVDTRVLGAGGFPVEEITGGCFCCRFNSLVEAADRLTAASRPDVFVAEPVGSCTDLVATVSYPLQRMYGERFSVAPLSVLVDPVRALRMLGMEPGRPFSTKVLYVYQKQLEEAELIVINKIDLIDEKRRVALHEALGQRFPRAALFEVSAREGAGLDAWFEHLLAISVASGEAPPLDYDLYAEGEALLGWLNATVRVSGQGLDGNRLLLDLADRVRGHLGSSQVEIAHLKMSLVPDEDAAGLCAVSLARGDGTPELGHALTRPFDVGELTINLRAESDPELLYRELVATLECSRGTAGSPDFQIEHLERFRPARPIPSYRLASV